MIIKLHHFVDYLDGFDTEYGEYYYDIDDDVVENYRTALEEYELACSALRDQFDNPNRKRNKTESFFEFELFITPPNGDDTIVTEKLYGYCDDGLFAVSNNQYSISFCREGKTLEDAVKSAIEDVKKADIGSVVIRIEPECGIKLED